MDDDNNNHNYNYNDDSSDNNNNYNNDDDNINRDNREAMEEEEEEEEEEELVQKEKYEDYFDIRQKVKNKLMPVNSIVHLSKEKHLKYFYKDISSDVVITLFQMAMRLNDHNFVSFLINNNVDVTLTTKDYELPLMTAILLRNRKFVEEILHSGGDPNLYSEMKIEDYTYYYSPLELAVKKNEPDIVDLLISKGGNINNRNPISNLSLLYFAVEHSSFEAMEILLSWDADVDTIITVNKGREITETALSVIIKRGVNVKATLAILKSLRIDINFIDSLGFSYLHHAVFIGCNPEIVDCLLDAGIEINIPDSDNQFAVQYEDKDNENCEACVKIVKRHIIMRVIADFDISNTNMEAIKNTELGYFPNECFEEVEKMKKHHLYNTVLTCYTLLHLSQQQAARKLEFVDISECLDDQIYSKFPIYSGMIVYRLDKARRYSLSYDS